jgi:2'-5' RNA ligase
MENIFTIVYNIIMNNKSDNIRLFIGTYINPDILLPESKLLQMQEYFSAPLKLVKKENIHFTWKFIGNADYELLDNVANTLQEIVKTASNIEVTFKKVELWPDDKFPRQLVVIGEDINGNADQLYKSLNHGFAKLGIKKEKRSFNPHITLARFKLRSRPPEPFNIPEWLEFDGVKINFSKINLIQSTLNPAGSIYKILKSYDLNQD